jgi:hypothetical protein
MPSPVLLPHSYPPVSNVMLQFMASSTQCYDIFFIEAATINKVYDVCAFQCLTIRQTVLINSTKAASGYVVSF